MDQKSIAVVYVKECSANVFLWKFYSIQSYTYVFDPFELVFVYGVKEYSNFILLHVAVQFS